MGKCLYCEKEVSKKEGKKERKFCSDTCRQKHWQKSKKQETRKVILIEDENGTWKTSDGKTCRLIWADDENLRDKITASPIPENGFDSEKKKDTFVDEFSQYEIVEPENDESKNRIKKIEELLLMPAKYLPKHKRNELEKELAELKK